MDIERLKKVWEQEVYKEMEKDSKREIVFKCKKCEHQLYVDCICADRLEQIARMECPQCGEDGHENWILSRKGNFEKEWKNK